MAIMIFSIMDSLRCDIDTHSHSVRFNQLIQMKSGLSGAASQISDPHTGINSSPKRLFSYNFV